MLYYRSHIIAKVHFPHLMRKHTCSDRANSEEINWEYFNQIMKSNLKTYLLPLSQSSQNTNAFVVVGLVKKITDQWDLHTDSATEWCRFLNLALSWEAGITVVSMLLWKSKLLLRINFTGLTLELLAISARVWMDIRERVRPFLKIIYYSFSTYSWYCLNVQACHVPEQAYTTF